MKRPNPVKISTVSTAGRPISYRESVKHHYRGYQDKRERMLYQEISAPLLNRVQQRVYDEALYGLKAFTPAEIAHMPRDRKQGIITRSIKVQDVLNRFKQEVANNYVDRILTALFPKSSIVKTFTRVKGHDNKIKSFQTFKELGLDQLKIAQKLVEEGLLPRNFFNLLPKNI